MSPSSPIDRPEFQAIVAAIMGLSADARAMFFSLVKALPGFVVQPATSIPALPAMPELPTPAPIPNAELLDYNLHPYDIHNAQQHEARMNAWLEDQIQTANKRKLELYQHAASDWQTNAQISLDKGLPIQPQPPLPVFDPVEPKPAGWWFKNS